jgi:hypothetical protein
MYVCILLRIFSSFLGQDYITTVIGNGASKSGEERGFKSCGWMLRSPVLVLRELLL